MKLIDEIRKEFPQLKRKARNGQNLVYLDNAATTLKPRSVLAAVQQNMAMGTANVHRGAHFLSDEATDLFESTRNKAAKLLNASQSSEIVFTRGVTESMNLLARSLGSLVLKEGDEILLSQMEHHSNIVPWQLIAKEKKATVRFVKVLADGSLDMQNFSEWLTTKTRIVSLVHLSNSVGTLNPMAELIQKAKANGSITVVDAAQSVAVYPLDVQILDCDFLTFSGHKIFAPTGVGVLYGRQMWLERMPPYQGGGSMISEVSEQGTTFLQPPHRFEAGTPAIAEVIGLGAAIDFINSLDRSQLLAHSQELMELIEAETNRDENLIRYGTAEKRSHIFSFLIKGHHPADVGAILDETGIAIRAGHHCCQPLMKRFGIPGTARASLSIYTSEQDIELFLASLKKAKDILL